MSKASEIDLAGIRARHAAATPGPWRSAWDDRCDDRDSEAPIVESEAPGLSLADSVVVGLLWYDGIHVACTEANAAFIAAAHTDVAALLAHVATVERERGEFQRSAELRGEALSAISTILGAEPGWEVPAVRRMATERDALAAILSHGDVNADLATLRNVQDQREKVVAAAEAFIDSNEMDSAGIYGAVHEWRRITGPLAAPPTGDRL